MDKLDVMVVGEIYIDHIFSGFERWPEPGEEVCTEHYRREAGGGTVITACALGRLGRNIGLLGVVGAEDVEWLKRKLTKFAVQHSSLLTIDGMTGVTLSVSTRNDRSFFTYPGVNDELANYLHKSSAVDTLSRAKHIHFAMPLDQKLGSILLASLHEAGCSISLDVGYQPVWLRDNCNIGTCSTAEFFLPNEKEAALMCGTSPVDNYFDFATKHAFLHAPLKCGAKGGYEMEHQKLVHVMPPLVNAVDTTGAGDAFDAGYIDAWLDQLSARQRLQRACICGSLSTTVSGALAGLPDRVTLDSVQEMTYES